MNDERREASLSPKKYPAVVAKRAVGTVSIPSSIVSSESRNSIGSCRADAVCSK